ncbi:DUF5683 domain-containing protein [Olleya aquimaris]|uniref:DUF5683 domain-containing protein n=1 Tax=Olleya aquimaris TaxID=639310 RepID=A0A327RLD0_9FLAO|nr:DUF5683 domain-containing protein [Olleya aquimaris]RAJ16792.1 hypothetical protein LY08_00567 [Olleya aquimaris]
MLNKASIFTLICCFLSAFCIAQETEPVKDTDTTTQEIPKVLKQRQQKISDKPVIIDSTVLKESRIYNPLSPSRAAFYSAVLPGLGQAYNRKYWKIPIVYAALGTSIYFYIENNKQYNRARDAYKRRLAGFEDDEFQNKFTDDALREAQKTFRRNKELSLLITVGIYALNIIDANVDAHLLQYNISNDLSLKPHYKIEEFDNLGRVGLTLNFQF